jgi:prepilin-type N-terminal cleavage/methylation domain-containing protein
MKKRGFTLIELFITIAIFIIVVPGILLFVEMTYRQYFSIANRLSINSAAEFARLKMQRDINGGGQAAVDPDNRGLIIRGRDFEHHYRLDRGKLTMKSSGQPLAIIGENLSSALWIKDGRRITVSLTFSFYNPGAHRVQTQKILKDLETK